jgi:hypothetical protein
MAKNTFVEKEPADYVYLKNITGAALVAGEFCIIGSFGAVAQEGIAINAYGGFLVGGNALIQTDTLTTSEDTFATVGQAVYFNNSDKSFSDNAKDGYFKVGQLNTVKDSNGVIAFNMADETVGNTPVFFKKTATLTSAAAAAPVAILTDAEVGAGRKAYVSQAFFSVDGGTNWATTANVFLQDTAASPVVGITAAVAALTANAMVQIGSTNITLAAPVADGAGFTTAKGLNIAGNANGTGSNLIVTIFGCIQ